MCFPGFVFLSGAAYKIKSWSDNPFALNHLSLFFHHGENEILCLDERVILISFYRYSFPGGWLPNWPLPPETGSHLAHGHIPVPEFTTSSPLRLPHPGRGLPAAQTDNLGIGLHSSLSLIPSPHQPSCQENLWLFLQNLSRIQPSGFCPLLSQPPGLGAPLSLSWITSLSCSSNFSLVTLSLPLPLKSVPSTEGRMVLGNPNLFLSLLCLQYPGASPSDIE